ncbi:kinesin-like protein KIN-6 isoform X2 [Jatropha curcas]|uniref:kinesin-like protein KIN-6 isoform X2 n=1 Tax=Jatropha curcas TaxID=180498 RepID=UPI0009D700B9|nr:kinesin-like protein KIN-6 isoform X2 [Jatropha curcas]
MEMKSPPPCPNTVTVRRNPPRRARPTPSTNPPQNLIPSSSTKPDVTPFPIQEILAMEIPQNTQPEPPTATTTLAQVSENLKVYLRIRPLVSPKPLSKGVNDQNFKQRHKNAWPQNPVAKKNAIREKNTKKKSSEICISVNDSQSVTLSPPQALQDSKRIKAVVYEGFSHVFPADASQNAVYKKMVKPLVEDFLNGKNGMLAALGPSGSGKTHTVFGTVREPGMVPLALQQIFKQNQECGSKLTRSFYISIFEIYSEGGKAERIFDLSPEGGDLSMQQSTIKGLQEVAVTDTAQAESLIASAMLKRATAMTNSNSQSSRSQCIINIHSLVNQCGEELDVQSNNSILTIVDLAGAERERRTGNQGSRLLESNFINNTSMVFGLCLRSLLEHQKNPKKPLQKHFQNSLLTRYLRDYLEGKKRMALILTVKPGEEDYLDAVYLLRQASPFMKIKFNNVDEQPNLVQHKRHIQSLSRVEEPRKKKYCGPEAHMVEEGKSSWDDHSNLEEDVAGVSKLEAVDIAPIKPDGNDLTIKNRNHQIMQNFARALWNVLKEYKEKLMVAEKHIESLRENLINEKTRYTELEEKLEDFKSSCTCSKENLVEATLLKVDTDVDAPMYSERNKCGDVDGMLNTKFKCDNSPTMCNLDPDLFSEVDVKSHSPNLNTSECTSTRCDEEVTSQMEENVHSLNVEESICSSSPRQDQDISSQKPLDPPPSHKEDAAVTKECNLDVPDCDIRYNSSCKSLNMKKPKRRLQPASSILLRDFSALGIEDEGEKPKGNRGGKKAVADERTQGNISLLRLLKSNLRI